MSSTFTPYCGLPVDGVSIVYGVYGVYGGCIGYGRYGRHG